MLTVDGGRLVDFLPLLEYPSVGDGAEDPDEVADVEEDEEEGAEAEGGDGGHGGV